MTAIEVLKPGEATLPELTDQLREQFEQLRQHALAFAETAAKIGELLNVAKSRVPDEEWPAWLEGVGLTPWLAFVFLRARAYPQLLKEHRPESVEALSRLLPQGEGSAYDREQAELARRLHEGGMGRVRLRAHLCVSEGTLTRWIDPEKYAKQRAAKAEKRERRTEREKADERARLMRFVKDNGGASWRAYEHLRKAAQELDTAIAGDGLSGDAVRALRAALAAVYVAEDRIGDGSRVTA